MPASSNVLDSTEILLVGADEWIPQYYRVDGSAEPSVYPISCNR